MFVEGITGMPHTLIFGVALLALVWVPVLVIRPEVSPENEI
jgi:hypothetical protein